MTVFFGLVDSVYVDERVARERKNCLPEEEQKQQRIDSFIFLTRNKNNTINPNR
jgi:hypothetical protein